MLLYLVLLSGENTHAIHGINIFICSFIMIWIQQVNIKVSTKSLSDLN